MVDGVVGKIDEACKQLKKEKGYNTAVFYCITNRLILKSKEQEKNAEHSFGSPLDALEFINLILSED